MTLVKDLMTTGVVTLGFNKTVFDAAVLMSEKMLSCLIVVDDNVPVGIVTERDFVRKVLSKKASVETQISVIMSKPLITINPDVSIAEAAKLMIKNHIRRLPVVKNNKLIGIIVASDFVKELCDSALVDEIICAMIRKRDMRGFG